MDTYIFIKNDRNVCWNAAHVYEHAFVESFKRHIRDLGYKPYLVCDISANTYRTGIIFLHATFYNDKVKEIFFKYYKNTLISEDDISRAINIVEAEELAKIKIINKRELHNQLNLLDNQKWVQLKEYELYYDQNINVQYPLVATKLNTFREIDILIKIPGRKLNDLDIALYSKLNRVISAAITDKLEDKYLAYIKECTLFGKTKNLRSDLTADIFVNIRKDIQRTEIIDTIMEALKEISDKKNREFVIEELRKWSETEYAQYFSEDYYKYTGVFMGSKKIVEVAKKINLTELFDNLEIEVYKLN